MYVSICRAYELYGDDAEKASEILGTKLLSKELEGGGSVAVTGFRESAWLSGSHRLWKTGEDVLLFKNGEIEKNLKASDYIPVGLVIKIDNHPYQIDAVDYKADEVTLHAAVTSKLKVYTTVIFADDKKTLFILTFFDLAHILYHIKSF